MTTAGRYIGAFGRFWWDFLVGDTPEIFLGVLLVVGVAALAHSERALAVVLVPVVVVAVLAGSTYRARKRA